MSPARSVVAMVVTWLLVTATSARSEHAHTVQYPSLRRCCR